MIPLCVILILQAVGTYAFPASGIFFFPETPSEKRYQSPISPCPPPPPAEEKAQHHPSPYRDMIVVNDDGFYFGNPRTDCPHASQPYIYSQYKAWSDDHTYIASLLVPDVDFTIVGHHPVSGHYHDFRHFYANAFWRIGTCIAETYPERFRIELLNIHGGCEEEWSVQEVKFSGRANNGIDFELINVWVTRWKDGRIVQARTYIDAQETTLILYQNEDWTNSTTHTDHQKFLPGPRGMPDMGWMAKYGHY
ncbi:hypothetical protein VTN02DRAFT_2356 [Thermoascus thermophilus]